MTEIVDDGGPDYIGALGRSYGQIIGDILALAVIIFAITAAFKWWFKDFTRPDPGAVKGGQAVSKAGVK